MDGRKSAMTYSVKEMFFTLQGEGARTGRPAVFVRFAGCNLWSGREQDRASAICQFCDTQFVGTDGDGGGKFATADALHLERLRRQFDTVLDCGLFHTFDGDERREYAESLKAVTRGTLYVLCFGEGEGVGEEGEKPGPHPVSREDLKTAFRTGWRITAIEKERVRTRFHDENGAPAWFATIERRPTGE